MIAHPAGQTDAVAIILAAVAMMLAATALCAAQAVCVLGARLVAIGPCPAGQASALPGHMIALAAVLTIALQLTVGAVKAGRAGMLTGETQVARPTDNLAGNMVAGGFAWQELRPVREGIKERFSVALPCMLSGQRSLHSMP